MYRTTNLIGKCSQKTTTSKLYIFKCLCMLLKRLAKAENVENKKKLFLLTDFTILVYVF